MAANRVGKVTVVVTASYDTCLENIILQQASMFNCTIHETFPLSMLLWGKIFVR